MNSGKSFWKMAASDATRIIPLMLLGFIIVQFSPNFAQWVNQPVYSAWGLFVGGSFQAGALTYIMRRMLFPTLEVTPLIKEAIKTPEGSGMIFLGICFIMGMIFMLFGNAITT